MKLYFYAKALDLKEIVFTHKTWGFLKIWETAWPLGWISYGLFNHDLLTKFKSILYKWCQNALIFNLISVIWVIIIYYMFILPNSQWFWAVRNKPSRKGKINTSRTDTSLDFLSHSLLFLQPSDTHTVLSQVGKALIEVSSSLMSMCALLLAFLKHCIAKRIQGSHGSWPGGAARWSCASPGQLQDSCSLLWVYIGRQPDRSLVSSLKRLEQVSYQRTSPHMFLTSSAGSSSCGPSVRGWDSKPECIRGKMMSSIFGITKIFWWEARV